MLRSYRGSTLADLPWSKASTQDPSQDWVKHSPPLKAKCFRVGYIIPCYRGLNPGRSVSMIVNKTRKYFSRNFHGARMFPQCSPVEPTVNIVCIQFLFPRCKLCLRYSEQLRKFCDCEQASTHLRFSSSSSKGQNLGALSN